MHLQGLLLTTALVALALVPATAGAQSATERVTVGTAGQEGNGESYIGGVSADGRLVVFETNSTNLIGNDRNGAWGDILVRDRPGARTSLVSVSSTGAQGNAGSYAPLISRAGRYVAFESFATNLVPGDVNGVQDVFLRDRQAKTAVRVSLGAAGGAANDESTLTGMSASGQKISFSSLATNLVAGDTNGAEDLFVRDLAAGTTVRANVSSSGKQGTRGSYDGLIAGGGRHVAFASDDTALVAGDTNGAGDIFVRSLVEGRTARVSVATGGKQGNGPSASPEISDDGRYVAFQSNASNLVAGDTNNRQDVFFHDRQTGVTSRISVSGSGAQANDSSYLDGMSSDGRTIVFQSFATNIVPNDRNGTVDVFVYDRAAGTTTRVSHSTAGAEGDGYSILGRVSADRRVVSFSSVATNLVAGDTNGRIDGFVRTLTLAPVAGSR